MKVKFEMALLKSGNFRRYYSKFKEYEKEFETEEEFNDYIMYHKSDIIKNIQIINE